MVARITIGFRLFVFVLVPGFLSGTTPSFAQESGRVSGVLLDPNNAVVIKVRVTIFNELRTYTVYSDENGRFQFEVPDGSYKLSAEGLGFVQYKTDEIKVTPGSKTNVSIAFTPGGPVECKLDVGEFRPIGKIDAPAPKKIQALKIR